MLQLSILAEYTFEVASKTALLRTELWEGNHAYSYLLSDHVWVMAGFDFEGAVVGPQINRICDTGHTALIDLDSTY